LAGKKSREEKVFSVLEREKIFLGSENFFEEVIPKEWICFRSPTPNSFDILGKSIELEEIMESLHLSIGFSTRFESKNKVIWKYQLQILLFKKLFKVSKAYQDDLEIFFCVLQKSSPKFCKRWQNELLKK